jgi:hypothetical protein
VKQTQGRRLIALLKNRYMTAGEMLRTGISVCPWKRVAECLQPNERLVKVKRGDLVAWHVVRTKG